MFSLHSPPPLRSLPSPVMIGGALLSLTLGLTLSLSAQNTAHATPRMSLTAGTPCSGCHVSPNGGGGRTELGWSSMNTAGAFTYGDLGVTSLHEQEHNGFADELVTIGFDARLQWARLGALNALLKRLGPPLPLAHDRALKGLKRAFVNSLRKHAR